MFTISREADYADRILVHMASSPQERFQSKILAKAEGIPESFLSKILQMLIRRRLVRSYRGMGGGYQLAAAPGKLTLYQLLEMVEGPLGLNLCVVSGAGCDFGPQCAVHDVWVVAQDQLRKTLDAVTIDDLARRKRPMGSRLVSIGDEPRDAAYSAGALGS
jgi:Rrf2 family transcriptional regulator, iron-sulfur cluster assembly transcription factor